MRAVLHSAARTIPRSRPARGRQARSALAVPAPDRRALADARLPQRSPAARAGLAAAAISRQLLLEVARRPVRREEVAQGGAAAPDRMDEDAAHRVGQQPVAFARYP